MRLMNYNIHSGKDSAGQMNLEAMAQAIVDYAPDFAFVEEVAVNVSTAGPVDASAFLQRHTGMACHFARTIDWQGGQYGIALLSRHPVTDLRVHPVPDLEESQRDGWFEHRVVLTCQTMWQGRPVTLMMTHLGLSDGERVLGFSLLEKLVDEAPAPVILAGDLNTDPDEALLRPLLRRLSMDSTAYTYSTEQPERKIDYILTSPAFRVEGEEPLPCPASDHFALGKVIEWK